MADDDELREDNAPLTAEEGSAGRCSTCKTAVPLPGRKTCGRCIAAARTRYAANVERNRARARAAYNDDPEASKARNRRWRAGNPERKRELGREGSRRYRSADPERRRRQHAAYRDRNRAVFRRYWSERKHRRSCDDPVAHREYAEVLAGDPCSYCGAPVDTMDHIVALARGGGDEWSNLTGACHSCNSRKWATPLLHFLIGAPRG